MELLCGACSQEQDLSLEERIQLAKSRVPHVTYTCPACTEEHAYQGIGGKDETIESNEPIQEAEEKMDDSDQLSLF